MLKFLRSLFTRQKKVQNFSTTLTTATEGETAKHKLNPDIQLVLDRCKKNKTVEHTDLCILSKYYFNVPNIEAAPYNLKKEYVNGMCFGIQRVFMVYNDNGDVDDIRITMSELTYNSDIELTLSAKHLHEFMRKFNPVVLNKE